MYDFMKCPECGDETEYRQENSTQGLYCKSCYWCVVTTYIPQIALDDTVYSVYVLGADYKNLKLIQGLSKVSGLKYIEVRKLLKQKRALIFEGKAQWVLDIIGILKSEGVTYEITPEYNY